MADETSPGTLPGAIPDPLREEAQKIFVPVGRLEPGEVSNIQPPPTALVCPECGRLFEKKQALTMHRMRSHGYHNPDKRKRKTDKPKAVALARDSKASETARVRLPDPWKQALEEFLPKLSAEIVNRGRAESMNLVDAFFLLYDDQANI